MLYIVATPIGNLEDISLRALRILSEVDFVLCEDTRVTKNLLNHYKIKTLAISYHQHSDLKKLNYILDLLTEGKNLALVSDAGTPGISDPGGKLVAAVFEKFGSKLQIESIPGPSAVTAALSISGVPSDKFMFMGFPPHKKGRQTFIKKIITSEYPVVVYESKFRIIKFLEELKKEEKTWNKTVEKKNKEQAYKEKKIKKIYLSSVVVCRELSKMHESVYRGEVKKIIEQIKDSPNNQKGEFVVIIGK
ncbi:MAG: 16S rRNA (cytidine(1402)-2'-O)-methyltransferase [Patescibacteria group bacterium]